MKLLRVGAAVLNQTPMAWEANRDNIVAAIEAARAEAVSLLCLPELCITGYGCEDMFLSPAVQETAWRMLGEIAPATRGMVVSVGLPVAHRSALYNCAAMLVDGGVAGLVAKQFLAGDGIHYEPRWFKPWPADRVTEHESPGGEKVPIGDLHFDVGGVGIGFEICEDAWSANRTGRSLAAHGLDLILNPSASHFAFGKDEVRRRLVLEGSRAFGVGYLYANLLGNEAGRIIYDGGAMIAAGGAMLAEGPRFSFAPFRLTTAVVDLDRVRMGRASLFHSAPDVAEDPRERVDVAFSWPAVAPSMNAATRAAWESGPFKKEEELTRAIALGLFDYLRKSASRGFVVSLSGGADSSACVCLIAKMVELALAELGADAVRQRLAPADPERLLTTLYQSTAQSSEATRASARAVAAAIGARHLELDVDPLVRGYVEMIERAIGRELSWEKDDVTLQNIQARVRGPGAWMIANIERALLLATSNRSEAAVGYTTMDGDTCGGVSPLAGIDKAFLRAWLRWLEKHGPEGGTPVPEVAVVNGLTPGPELRPAAAKQSGEGDLMPYPVLDAIERYAIRDKKSPEEVLALIGARFPDADAASLALWVRRFFTLWSQNQWKRERYAPAFHLDDENLDPKTWCRFPILSGAYRLELSRLPR